MNMQRRFFSEHLGGLGSTYQNMTNQFIVLQAQPVNNRLYPSIQLRFDGPQIMLTHEMTLKDLERNLLSTGEASKTVEFFDGQGGKLSYSSKLRNVLELSNFNMMIDRSVQYHCHSTEGFSDQINIMSPEQF